MNARIIRINRTNKTTGQTELVAAFPKHAQREAQLAYNTLAYVAQGHAPSNEHYHAYIYTFTGPMFGE